IDRWRIRPGDPDRFLSLSTVYPRRTLKSEKFREPATRTPTVSLGIRFTCSTMLTHRVTNAGFIVDLLKPPIVAACISPPELCRVAKIKRGDSFGFRRNRLDNST